MWILFFLTLLASLEYSEGRNKKAVITSLHAKWSQTSFLAEASEFMAKESNVLFWNYVDLIAERINVDEWTSLSQEKQHNVAVRLANSYLGDSRTELLKFALSLRTHSPTVQLFQQLGSENSGVDCEAYAEFSGKFACTSEELKLLVERSGERDNISALYSLDHVFPKSEDVEEVIVVYGELGTRSWLLMHNAAKAIADSGIAKYVFRHWIKEPGDEKVLLSGYGVELAIKNTEYKAMDDSKIPEKNGTESELEGDIADYEDICGFNFNILRKIHKDLKDSLEQFRLHLLEKDELTPLKVWQVQDLAFQASQKIRSSPPEKALSLLTELSQNFPLLARSLTRQSVKKEFRNEVESNQKLSLSELGLNPGENALFINGILVDVDSLDVFHLLDLLKQEEKLADGFFRMGLNQKYIPLLINLDFPDDSSSYALDFRSGRPEYMNNLDTDKRYREWGNSVKLMLQPYFPGMIRPIARNFFTLIFVLDLSEKESHHLLKFALTFYKHEIPLRIGVIFVVNNEESVSGFEDSSVAMLNLYNFVKSDSGTLNAFKALNSVYEIAKKHDVLSSRDVMEYFSEFYPDIDPNTVFGADSSYNSGKANGQEFLHNSGLTTTPKALLNGVVLDDAGLKADRFEETVISAVMKATSKIQKAVITGKLKDRDNVMNWILSQPEVMPRINKRILGAPSSPNVLFLDLTDIQKCPMRIPTQFHRLPQAEHNQCILEKMHYITRSSELQTRYVTLWVVADFEDSEGRKLAYTAIKRLKHSHNIRIGFISNPVNIDIASNLKSVSMLMNAAMRLLQPTQAKQFVTKVVKEEIIVKYLDGTIKLEDMAVNGMNVEHFRKEFSQLNSDEVVAGSKFVQRALLLKPGERAIVANGMLVGPLNDDESFNEADIQLLEKLILSRGAKTIASHAEKWLVKKDDGSLSDIVLRTAALIGRVSSKKKRIAFSLDSEDYSVMYLPPKMNAEMRASLEAICVIDPLSKAAQKMGALLEVIREVVNIGVKMIFNPQGKLSELPLKRFYRLVLQPSVTFDSSGGIVKSSYQARFASLPEKQLLTLSVTPSDSWMVESVYAVYDLDNIKMENVDGSVVAEFQLENILLDGHCFDENSGSPPRGLQYTLGTRNDPTVYDTIVMANLGYFQLKANPGAWILRLREGKSRDIYEISNHYNTESEESGTVHVLIDSFRGRTIRVQVAKKEGMQDQNLLSEGKTVNDDESSSLWNTISSTLSGGEKYDTINIFSLASGHLYERFMRIMMLSVMKHTKYPVKFWLLKNYLSPNFKETLPVLADYYGFQYELVEYKWPRWLHQQTEKQRVMWGYKILFLDVLFPLDVRKIIFVDADQIVRADLMELMELDLGGAPYGFTPFCDSRKSMEGFRFWKKGYWANHLAGRKYHISAIYVVDLVKFRQIAAGDRLRGQYQGLSGDPNSLANLDQDLPNNMIHQVRIKSLPQEWLWCETWCDDESKRYAKTIDMCNNPLTKEPKLQAAMRIAAEWKDYDAEIRAVLSREKQKDASKDSGTDGLSHSEL